MTGGDAAIINGAMPAQMRSIKPAQPSQATLAHSKMTSGRGAQNCRQKHAITLMTTVMERLMRSLRSQKAAALEYAQAAPRKGLALQAVGAHGEHAQQIS